MWVFHSRLRHLSSSPGILALCSQAVKFFYHLPNGRCGGPMVSSLDSGIEWSDFEPRLGHCIVFLGKTLYSHSDSLHPGV